MISFHFRGNNLSALNLFQMNSIMSLGIVGTRKSRPTTRNGAIKGSKFVVRGLMSNKMTTIEITKSRITNQTEKRKKQVRINWNECEL